MPLRALINFSLLTNLFEIYIPTFFINVAGSFLIGYLLILLTDKIRTNETSECCLVGFRGTFTTISTFEAEILRMIRERFMVKAFLYL